MTAKKGDIVFVTQGHTSQPVAAVVMDHVSNIDEVSVHVISSSDPYSVVKVSHRFYSDDVGYLEADEAEPLDARPVAPPVDNDHVEEGAELFGLGQPNPDVSNEDPTDSGGDPPTDESGDQGSEEEEDDESEEDESSSTTSEGDEDGKPVSATRGKRGKGRKR